jgi:hypothetical protein
MMWGSFVLKMTAVFKHSLPLPPLDPVGDYPQTLILAPSFPSLAYRGYASLFSQVRS